ncbi:hypothetical protein GW17_00061010 [Ensete ventricosum]|nr:hypothetical protein GW17_00061010 [Ensete ventricosum]
MGNAIHLRFACFAVDELRTKEAGSGAAIDPVMSASSSPKQGAARLLTSTRSACRPHFNASGTGNGQTEWRCASMGADAMNTPPSRVSDRRKEARGRRRRYQRMLSSFLAWLQYDPRRHIF